MEQPYAPPSRSHYNLGLASLIVGIASLPLACCLGIGLISGIVAIVLGVMSMNAEKRAGVVEDSAKTLAIIGVVLGAIACLIGLAVIALYIVGMTAGSRGGSPFGFPGPRFPR